MAAHHVPVATDERDALPAALAQRIDRFNDGLLQVGAHGVEERGSGIDVDEHAVGQRLVQRLQVVPRQGRGAKGHEAGVVLPGLDQGAHVREERQRHHVLGCSFAQRLAYVGKVGVLGPVGRVEVFEHGDGQGDAGAGCAQRVAELVGDLNHSVSGGFFRGKARIARQDARHGGLRESRRLGNVA